MWTKTAGVEGGIILLATFWFLQKIVILSKKAAPNEIFFYLSHPVFQGGGRPSNYPGGGALLPTKPLLQKLHVIQIKNLPVFHKILNFSYVYSVSQ